MKIMDDLLDSKKAKAILAIFIGIILIKSDQSEIFTSKTIGWVIIIFSILWLITDLTKSREVKKSLKSSQIKILEHKLIAEYLEKNGHRYVYKPKDYKKLDFYVTDLDVYIKYLYAKTTKQEENAIDKESKRYDLDLIKIPSYVIKNMKKLHGSFSNKLAKIIKKR